MLARAARQADPARIEVAALPRHAAPAAGPLPGARAASSPTPCPETLWLDESGFENLLLAYPSVDRTALQALARRTREQPEGAPIVMVDSTEHLDLIEAAVAGEGPVRVCLDFDASLWVAGGRLKVGPKRTPVHTVAQARALAEDICRRAPSRSWP